MFQAWQEKERGRPNDLAGLERPRHKQHKVAYLRKSKHFKTTLPTSELP